ncbi:hypothetical protein LEP1GSC021_4402 [Leptospira noguchii str. 1993005606]|uniref:Uncharacterized protein n=2 Tax=Leptospira noguchii TaxID=28182 RepID=M6YPL3_9LEPT|nr:hypothetical protein [Leptospira noguchii]EMM98313.1 hypothetical protein LEP1GSC035_0670 [Leptospira noguchii str. 2007001578]EMO88273.1 hypothetical protein LEP1GSC024_1898 [Leptospira noguchii str. 2001034031]EPE86191.1 hypothetical protein LEP1GSC021_4402 [Leptospira noguchii str. 1993005606]UOG62365.1 hypothetical protein MAL07_19030 [Leptospira noguchii]
MDSPLHLPQRGIDSDKKRQTKKRTIKKKNRSSSNRRSSHSANLAAGFNVSYHRSNEIQLVAVGILQYLNAIETPI